MTNPEFQPPIQNPDRSPETGSDLDMPPPVGALGQHAVGEFMSEQDSQMVHDLKQLGERGRNPYYTDFDEMARESEGYIETEGDQAAKIHAARIANRGKKRG